MFVVVHSVSVLSLTVLLPFCHSLSFSLVELISVVVKTTKRLQQRGTAALLLANQKLDFKDGASNNLEVILDTLLSPELALRYAVFASFAQLKSQIDCH